MYLLGYSVDNLSLMAMAISTGFVVDDAIVVIENITRYLEMGMRPAMAALTGAKEIAFTVLSMSTSLVAVFIPILLMSGILGRLYRVFEAGFDLLLGGYRRSLRWVLYHPALMLAVTVGTACLSVYLYIIVP